MASPLAPAKQSVSLAAPAVRGSRIRRDPPPKPKKIDPRDQRERDTQTVVIGVLLFTLALLVIALALASYNGWSPRDYTAYI